MRGAALIGGALLASRLREAFPGLRITESHPKALLPALRLDETHFADRYQIETGWCNEHERDAAVAWPTSDLKPCSEARGQAPGGPRATTRFAALPCRGYSSPAPVRRPATRMAHATALRTGPSSREALHTTRSNRDQYGGLFPPPVGQEAPEVHAAPNRWWAPPFDRTQTSLRKVCVSRDTRSARMVFVLPRRSPNTTFSTD